MNKKSLLLLLLASTSLAACSMPSWMGGRDEEKPKLVGERTDVLGAESTIKIDDSLKKSSPVLPVVTANAEWAQSGGGFAAETGNLAGGKFDDKTSASAGGGNSFSHSLVPQPVVAGGMVFAMDAAGVVSAHDAADVSKILWTSSAVADADEHEVFGGGMAAEGGVLYAASGQGAAAALDAKTGKKIWQKNFSAIFRGAPKIAGDKLIVITIDSQTYALSTKTGDMLWSQRGINETAAVMNSVSAAVFGDDVLVPYSSGEIFALSLADGKELWGDSLLKNSYTQGDSVFTGIGGNPVVDGGVAFVTGSGGLTAAINLAQGKRIWQEPIGAINTPWLAGSELFVLTSDNVLVDMVKYTGKVRWKAALPSYENPEAKKDPIAWRGPVLVAGKLLLTGSNGQMAVVSAESGKILEMKSIPSDVVTSPVVAGGRLYSVGRDATLYSFK